MGIRLYEVDHREIKEAPFITPEIADYLDAYRTDGGVITVHKDELETPDIEDLSQELTDFIAWLRDYIKDGEYHDINYF